MIRSILVVAALAAVVPDAGAQTIYKYVRPDGSIVYTDKPVSNARLEEELEPPPPPSPVEVEQLRADRDALQRAADQRASSIDLAALELKEWTPKLTAAKARLEAGREPRPGERIGTYSGKSRLNADYWARQRGNQAAVWEAETRIQRAQAVINATR